MKIKSKIKRKKVQATVGFWLEKLQSQIKIIEEKKQVNEQISILEISLAFLFLYLFTEATLDYYIDNLCLYSNRKSIRKSYRDQRTNLRGKLEFVFDNLCSKLSYSDYLILKTQVKEITRIRNSIIHLEVISWEISGETVGELKENPNHFTGLLTEQNLRKHLDGTQTFFINLNDTLNRGLNYEKYPENGSIDGIPINPTDKDPNLADYIFKFSVPKFPKFSKR